MLHALVFALSSFPYWLPWLLLAIVFFVIEGATVNLTTVWFGIGAIVALVLATFGVSFAVQLIVFFAVSILTLAIFLFFLKPKFNIGVPKVAARTNADRILDAEAVVTKTVDPLKGTGQILVNNQYWSASTPCTEPLEEGQKVRVLAIEGVRAIVEPLNS